MSTTYTNPLAGLSVSDKAALRDALHALASAPTAPNPTLTPQLPRIQVGADASGWVNSNAQAQRDISDLHGLTGQIEDLFAQRMTAKQVTAALGEKLAFLPAEERPGLAVAVRATLGIPSRFEPEGAEAFEKWLADRTTRLQNQVEGAQPNSIPEPVKTLLSGSPKAGEAFEAMQQLHQRAQAGDEVAALLLRGVDAELAAPGGRKTRQAAASSAAPVVTLAAAEARDQEGDDRAAGELEPPDDTGNAVEAQGPLIPERDPYAVPDSVGAAFGRRGNRFTDPNEPRKTVFVDRGNRLQTAQNFDAAAVRAMIETAEARGWTAIKVTGTEEFRRAAWFEAAKRGIEVSGYKPTEAEKKAADQMAARNPKTNTIQENELVRAYRTAQDDTARMQASKAYPMLKDVYALEAALDKFAASRLKPEDRERFMQHQRALIEKDLANGIAFKPVAIRQQARPERQRAAEQEA